MLWPELSFLKIIYFLPPKNGSASFSLISAPCLIVLLWIPEQVVLHDIKSLVIFSSGRHTVFVAPSLS